MIAAALIVVAATAFAGVAAGTDPSATPRRSIDVSSPLTQSDPDASGHPRPRAPGHAAVVL
ncbi:DUF6412 domain-containing protein [Microbacterium sp. cx-59]|uniref:DUF6412 domain-containing protein n=1 Tax=Microbacterium sp. cx-59 TaxID=2891207 RepID=UPI001E45E6E9|nr:DUF6412 domain-containing protein [Microbacterium sp. cx-59]MCC4907550.1 DUF6412 domain-containing protein [Microbacterium sp. cx-59]